MAVTHEPHNIERAILFSLLAYAAFSCSDGLRKLVAQDHAIVDILFWQAICGLTLITILSPFMGGVSSLVGLKNLKWQVVRGVVFALNTTFSLNAISRIPLMDAYTIFFLTPFLIAILGALLFKEPIGIYRGLSVLAGFIGAFIAFRPGFEAFHPAYFFAIACIFTFSAASILGRHIGRTHGLLGFAFWPSTCLIIGIFIYRGGAIPPMHDLEFMLYTAVMGAAYSAALIIIAYSYTLAPAAVVAPYQYIQIVFATLFGYFVFNYVPDGPKIAGACIIVGAGVVLFTRERAVKKRQALKKAPHS